MSVSVTGYNFEATDSAKSQTTQVVVSYLNGTVIPINSQKNMTMAICTPRVTLFLIFNLSWS